MKFLHLADLHIGKKLNDFSLIEDQKYILTKIVNIVDETKPDGVIIAGDVYDKAIPSAEAVEMFDDFLYMLSKRNLQVFVISGNHDSAERIAFGRRLMNKSGIHMSPVYDGNIEPITLTDDYGNLNVYMLPFIKPGNVRRYYDEEINSYTDAVKIAIKKMNIDKNQRNLIVTHQFVAGAQLCDSEEILSVGGTDQVAYTVFDEFDYVALGHIHSPQHISKETIRYSGTPLKYSFSECSHKKSVTVVDFKEKGKVEINTIPLIPKRDLVEIKGEFDEITKEEYYKNLNTDDYYHITLTDDDIPDVINKLRKIYPNTMKLTYDNKRTQSNTKVGLAQNIENKSEYQLFAELYEKQNGTPLSEEQTEYLTKVIEKLKEN